MATTLVPNNLEEQHSNNDVSTLELSSSSGGSTYFSGRILRTRHRYCENLTRIDARLYKAAVEGDFNEFVGLQNIESLLTPNKNTVLHIHLASTTSQKCAHHEPLVSQCFVEQILANCTYKDLVLLPNSLEETPLHLAARYGHSAILSLLIARARTLDLEEGIQSGNHGMLTKLIRATTSEAKDTALHEAVRHNHIEVVEILLDLEDAELPNMANQANETPLYLAAERQYTAIVHKILEKVQSPAYEGPDGRTALHAAVIHCDLEMTTDFLNNQHLRAAVKHQDKIEERVPLHYAAEAGNKFLTKWLLEKDEDTAYMQDKDGCTALHIAAKRGHQFIVEMFLIYYPDCSEVVDDAGRNALHYAVIAKRYSLVTRIMRNLSFSNLYNQKDNLGNTPLHWLAKFQISCKDLICHRRVDKLALNKQYETALDLAYATVESSPLRKQRTIEILEKVGAKRSQRITGNAKSKKKDNRLEFTKEAKESHLIVATLIATVTFAAAFTLPGGNYQDGELKGSPILRDKASFKAFIVSNTIAMVMATSAAFIHLFSPLEKVKWLDYYSSEAAFSFTVVAIATMIIAFVTGMYAVLGSS